MRQHRRPFRPTAEITQTYNDGVVKLYVVGNIAAPGYRPSEGLQLKNTLFYNERTVGVNRYYSAKQAQVEISKVIRVQNVSGINPQMVAVTEDGEQHHVEQVQTVSDSYPPSLDLTLSKIKQKYEVTV